jgi:hypothetical protein
MNDLVTLNLDNFLVIVLVMEEQSFRDPYSASLEIPEFDKRFFA